MKTKGSNAVFMFFSFLIVLVCAYYIPVMMPGDFYTTFYSDAGVNSDSVIKTYVERSFAGYITGILTLDFGYSKLFMVDCFGIIFKSFLFTAFLSTISIGFSFYAGLFLGLKSAWRKGGKLDKSLTMTASFLEGIPDVVVASVLLILFSLKFAVFPSGGTSGDISFSELLSRSVLPVFSLIILNISSFFLAARASALKEVDRNYVEVLRAKGTEKKKIIYRHILINSISPVISRLGVRLSYMLTSIIAVEAVFSYPGLGGLLMQAVNVRDIDLIRGIVVFSSFFVFVMMFLVDFINNRLSERL